MSKKAMGAFYCGKEIFKPLNTGWTDNYEFAFAHRDKLCSVYKKKVHDPNAPYHACGLRCDYTICGDRDPYLKEHPEYWDEAG